MSKFHEEREPLIPIGVSMKCDMCDEGYLEIVDANQTTSSTIAIYPPPKPKYLHMCTNDLCDNQAYFEDVYPGIEYADLEDFVNQ